MLNFNQNIIRQLNIIYDVSFKQKYKLEIKQRISDFVSYIILNTPNRNIFEKLNSISSLVIINDNKIKTLTNLFFKEYKNELFNFFNPLWFDYKTKTIYTKKQKEIINHEIFNAFAERFHFQINETICKALNDKAHLEYYYTFIGLNSPKPIIKKLNTNKQCNIFDIDNKIIKKYFSAELQIIHRTLHRGLFELSREIEDNCYEQYGITKNDLSTLNCSSNLIIEEPDIKNKTKVLNINIGFDNTLKVKTKNRIHTKIFIKFIYFNRYIDIINKILL